MTEPIDWARFLSDTANREVDASIRLATARMNLAEQSVDIIKKQIANTAEVAKQNRMREVWQEYQRTIRREQRILVRAEKQRDRASQKLRDLMRLLTFSSPVSTQHGWTAFYYFLQRASPELVKKEVQHRSEFTKLRRANKVPEGELFDALVQIIQELVEGINQAVDKLEAKAEELEQTLHKLKGASWKIVDLDPSWISK